MEDPGILTKNIDGSIDVFDNNNDDSFTECISSIVGSSFEVRLNSKEIKSGLSRFNDKRVVEYIWLSSAELKSGEIDVSMG